MKLNTKRILLCIAAVFMLAYVIFQVTTSLKNTVKTEYTTHYTYFDNIKAKAYIVKKETVLEDVGGGTVSFLASNGQRVSQGSVVAKSFSDDEQAEAMIRANELSDKIEQFEKIGSMSGGYLAAQAERLEDRVNEALCNYFEVTDGADLRQLSAKSGELLSVLNESALASGGASDFSAKVEQLKAEKQALEAKCSNPLATVTAPVSGYYVNMTDSLEGYIDPEKALELTCDEISDALSQNLQTKNSGSGKIINGYEWYFTCVIDEGQSEKLAVGDGISVYIPNVTADSVPVRVAALNHDRAGDRCAVVLECTYMTGALSSLRCEDIEICVGSYTGLRVPADAVRVVDGITGVYVISGVSARFKPIDIVYNDGGFVVAKTDNTNSSALTLYEELIVSGGDLYDGKVVK